MRRKQTFKKELNDDNHNETQRGNEMSVYRTKFHRDGTVTVTIWNVYAQQWMRTSEPSDRMLASLPAKERQRIMKHLDKVRNEQ